MLEELCRALSSSPSADTALLWEELLGGPLTSVLQSYSELGALSAQACDILATMSPQAMEAIKVQYTVVIWSCLSVCLLGDCLFVCVHVGTLPNACIDASPGPEQG